MCVSSCLGLILRADLTIEDGLWKEGGKGDMGKCKKEGGAGKQGV